MSKRAAVTLASIALVSGLFTAGQLCAQESGPFGLYRGMTKTAALSIIGKSAVKEDKTDALGGSVIVVSTVPKPYREFESYHLIFSKTDGLLKIMAVGKDISTSEEGTQLREHYSELKILLTNTYSTPQELDFLKSDNEALAEPGYFMLSLLQHERDLACVWPPKDEGQLKDHIHGVVLEAQALHLDIGYLTLTYEFDGWGAYVDKLKAAEANVL